MVISPKRPTGPLILKPVKKLEKLFIAPKVRQVLYETPQRVFTFLIKNQYQSPSVTALPEGEPSPQGPLPSASRRQAKSPPQKIAPQGSRISGTPEVLKGRKMKEERESKWNAKYIQ
ncbi:MAG: hypothetical protein BHV90_12665 [Clostridiales bacterium 42_27]|nr:MAG: hypothetical protein BHV90_12665 [Clostridiales bacterium 42_27]